MAEAQPIIVIKKKINHGGHHGGAWKVAYADFVTAMMALFIVLWLLNSSVQVRKAISAYFRDPLGTGNFSGTSSAGNGEALNVTKDDMVIMASEVGVLDIPAEDILVKERLHPGKIFLVDTAKGRIAAVYGGKCVENFTQAVARCIVGEQLLRVAKRYKPVLTVHDAVACVAPEAEAEEAEQYVIECMSWRPRWAGTLPLACEAGRGASYGDC